MPELTPKERLQPSLLDRLTDEEPGKQVESRDKRVLTLQKLRAAVLRDVTWLLNTCNLETTDPLGEYPLVKHSVLNFGMHDLTGQTASGLDVGELERALRQAIMDFEPRLVRSSLKVRAVVDPARMSHNALTFEIEGELWAQPLPIRLFLRTELDLESGNVSVQDA